MSDFKLESQKVGLPSVFMYGGGRQTIAICVLIIQGKLPLPDFTLIADTEREKQSTWDYLEKFVRPNYPQEIIRIPKSQFATVDLFRGEYLLMPAWTNQSGQIGKLETFCSNEWKVRVCERYLSKRGIKDFVSWIGFSSDEKKRFQPKRKSMGDRVFFPLVDSYPLTKQGCIDLVKDFGWPEPIHSACWSCPLQDDNNWRQNSIEDQAKAIELDEFLRTKDPNVFLHHSGKPLREVKFDSDVTPRPCDSGICML